MQKSAFWVEFIIMVGILLLVTEMTLLGVSKAHQMSLNNQRDIEASVQLQNLMEYCKIHKNHLEESLETLEGTIKYQDDWIRLYNENWEVVQNKQDSHYYIRIHNEEIPYEYHQFQEIKVGAYTLEDEALILELEGGVYI